MTRIEKRRTMRRPAILGAFMWLLCAILLTSQSMIAQDYELMLNQRRMGDQIGVEVWAKSLTAGAPKLGNMTVALVYNDVFLKPADIATASGLDTGNPAAKSDSIYYDMNVTQPYITIESPFADPNSGFNNLDAQAVEVNNGGTTAKVFTLQTMLQDGGAGYLPLSTGKGSLVGVLKFDILDPAMVDLADTDLTQIEFNTAYQYAPTTVVTDYAGNDVTDDVTLTTTPDFAIRDITILSPANPSSAIRRNVDPALPSIAPNNGYPVFFERSGLLTDLETYGVYGTSTLGYQVALSLQGGLDGTWTEVGRFAETALDANSMGGNNDYYFSGEISKLSTTEPYYVTQGSGDPLPTAAERRSTGYGGIIRFVWEANENFAFRSEEAVLKISQLEFDELDNTVTTADIDDRDVLTDVGRWDITDYPFTLGRMFFAQLNGTDQYFRTEDNISSPTKLTVGAWVNLNTYPAEEAEPAILASGNPNASNEGPWMLYLKNGGYPAFRAIERDEETLDSWIADVVSPDRLDTIGSMSPIIYGHGDNWVHIAATVDNGTITLFLNGEIVAKETNTTRNIVRIYPMQHPIYVGVNPNDDGLNNADNYLHAGIKEIKFWRAALTQDQIRQYLAGVYQPDNVTEDNTNDRRLLELYYPLQANHDDYADVLDIQWGDEELNFYSGGSLTPTNEAILYRPDRSHVVLTSPIGGEGISNRKGDLFEVRWAGYGLGSVNPNTEDLQIMISRDGGDTWFDAIGQDASPALPLDQVEIEAGSALWSPYNNNTISGYDNDLQSVVSIDENYAKACMLRISGTEEDGLDGIYAQSDEFTVAPNFAFANTGTARVTIPSNDDLSLTGSTNMIEAWIKPYRLPSEQEGAFPIFTKKENDNLHYAFRLLSTGQLSLSIFDTLSNASITAVSSAYKEDKVVGPNSIADDSTWTHVVAWFNLADGGEASVRFYIDGVAQTADSISGQFGSNVLVDRNNQAPAYIGYEPFGVNAEDGSFFIGQIKEVRFWNGNPGDVALSGVEPSDLTMFIQGAQGIRANEFTSFAGVDYSENLVAAWTFNGGSWINGGLQNSIAVYPELNNEDLIAVVYGDGFQYEATEPFIKLVEPRYKQNVSNQEHDLRVRWVGWDYDRNNGDSPFRNGSDATNYADLDFSVGGGGGVEIQPYQSVASQAYNDSYRNSMMFNYLDKAYEFLGSSDRTQYAADLDMAYVDPDLDDNYEYSDQGAVSASQTNGRFKLVGRATINGSELTYDNDEDGLVYHLLAESELFNITPPSNFTVRVLLEGYHTGTDATTGGIQEDIGMTFADKGLSIQLYDNQANLPGEFIESSVSEEGYFDSDARSIDNLNAGTLNYGNVPYVFTELQDGRYFVTVDHINHLPVTSAYAAPFVYTGDDQDTWEIESGWDFTSWNGVSGNDITQNEAMTNPPTMGSKYSAKGPSETDPDEAAYARKQLIFNDGRSGGSTNAVAAMVGGDVRRDGTIDAFDRVDVNSGVGGVASAADVTGDGQVNADDRIIVYRNAGITTSAGDHPTGAVVTKDNLGPVAAPLLMADYHAAATAEAAAMVRAEQAYYENGGTNSERIEKAYKIKNRLQGAGGISYEVSAVAKKVDQYIDVEVFVRNTGDSWAMGNSTFGLDYDASALKFDSYMGSNILFNNSQYGYSSPYSNPSEGTPQPMPELRTIDIVHAQDAPGEFDGVEVPSELTSLGVLRFRINRTADYYFEWHTISTVHDVDGLSLTENGDFTYIEPVLIDKTVQLTYPTPGTNMQANRGYIVEWTEPEANDMMVDLYLSTNNGDNWKAITVEPVEIGAMEYYWITPNVNSSECRMQLREVETQTIIDQTAGTFSILAAPIDIVKPCSICGTLLGGSVSEIVWNTDRDVNVYFEFSANGLNDWTTITDVLNTTTLSTTWNVPEVNTSEAVVRMMSTEGEVLAVSTPFSILTGALAITSPRDEIVIGGEAKEITWAYDNVDVFDIEFSVDGGNTWEVIANDVNASSNAYIWYVPNINTDNAMLRAIFDDTPSLEYDRVSFVITPNSKVNDPASLGYTLGAPVPNPFNETAEMSFTLPERETVTAELYNAAGNKVATLINGQSFSQGSHTFVIDADGLATGTYIVYMTVDQFTLTQRVIVIK